MRSARLSPHDAALLRRMCVDGSARRLREAGRYTQQEAATICSTTVREIASWENGEHLPSHARAVPRYFRFLDELTQMLRDETAT